MPYTRATELALLEWVRVPSGLRPWIAANLIAQANTFPLNARIATVPDLTDGAVFAKMLEDIDSTYAVRNLEKNATTSKWLGRKKSLEAIHRSLLRYINNTCEGMEAFITANPVDLNAIAEHEDAEETFKVRKPAASQLDLVNDCGQFLTMFLMAAIRGTNTEKYVSIITTSLDAPTQTAIAGIIKQIDAVEDTPVSSKAPPTLADDPGLALEGKFAALAHDHEMLKKKHADFISRFERLQQNHDELLEHSSKQDNKLKRYENSDDGDQSDYIRSLNIRIQEQEDLIASQENQIESDRIAKEKLVKELSNLRPAAQRLVEVEDEVKELKTANIALSRKANTVEHYQKKVEQLSVVEKENTTLRDRLDTLQGNQKDFDRVYDENTKIKATLKEYQQRFHSYELTYVELSTQKKHIEEQLRLRDDQLQVMTARQQHDEKFIDQLQEQIKTNSAGPISPDSPTSKPAGLSLEDELERSEDATPSLMLEISRLKVENQLLKSNTAGTTSAALQLDLEESERVKKRLQENLRELTEKHTLGQEQLSAMISESANEKEEAILHTRKLYLEANQELTAAKAKLAELEAELSSRDRDLVSTKTDLAAVDQEEIEAINNLKAAHDLITASFENDLLVLQNKHKALSTDFDEQKSQLIDALLSKDRLGKDLAAGRGGSGTTDESHAQAIIEAEAKQREQIQKQDALIQDLQRMLKTAQENTPEAQKVTYTILFPVAGTLNERNNTALDWQLCLASSLTVLWLDLKTWNLETLRLTIYVGGGRLDDQEPDAREHAHRHGLARSAQELAEQAAANGECRDQTLGSIVDASRRLNVRQGLVD
ncbi:M protein repeat protein [Drepanopeziza brunnea f. sp. 'multigermtubi' MB_m1]|uniref:M protein repeat protein n=1 Tax=Marssonina brunnea f. sp. multigermtubi (strain MB_m1) TaxID=1072389 RepID=K1X1F0_MARBU|nr:M protein repeat protein [Drepanopeziza brunnea f. sp. 'multigermtubi' MB_m1]EKD19056.1 M protein repeat protein [Drepanopeziza brunnea f. sp. 'multigermtubi' MB_m1]